MKLSKLVFALGVQAVGLAGCYVVPVGPDGNYAIYLPVQPPAGAGPSSPGGQPAYPAAPRALQARLYPDNDIATQTGMVSGTVTNMMNGKGRFQINYAGELLAGEATRVSGDERKGIASAYGPSGAFMSCEYQMHTPLQGAGQCLFSNGAKYKVHIGS